MVVKPISARTGLKQNSSSPLQCRSGKDRYFHRYGSAETANRDKPGFVDF